jgi:hypothetical protein
LNIHCINVRQTEYLHNDAAALEIDTATLKTYKLPGTDQIPAELIQIGGTEFHSNLLVFGIWKNCRTSGRNL